MRRNEPSGGGPGEGLGEWRSGGGASPVSFGRANVGGASGDSGRVYWKTAAHKTFLNRVRYHRHIPFGATVVYSPLDHCQRIRG